MNHPATARTLTGLVAFALVLSLLPATATLAAPSPGGATLAPAVDDFLDDAASDDALAVIVTLHDRAGLERLAALDADVDTLESVPIGHATLTAAQIREVASWAETRSVWNDEELELYLDESRTMIGAERVWNGDGLARPYLGTGVAVAVIDLSLIHI